LKPVLILEVASRVFRLIRLCFDALRTDGSFQSTPHSLTRNPITLPKGQRTTGRSRCAACHSLACRVLSATWFSRQLVPSTSNCAHQTGYSPWPHFRQGAGQSSEAQPSGENLFCAKSTFMRTASRTHDRSPHSREAQHFAKVPRHSFATYSTIAPSRSPARASRAPRRRQRRGALAVRAVCDPQVLGSPLAPGRLLRRRTCISVRGREGPWRRRK
jgi:hypothetical protein